MSWHTPAERGWWGNYERPTADATRYGANHRPAYERTHAGYIARCGCQDSCDRADDPLLYQTWFQALDAAAINLEANEHGPAQGQEQP